MYVSIVATISLLQAEYVVELSRVLHRTDAPSHIRQAAGLQVKNQLLAKDEEKRRAYLHRLVSLVCFMCYLTAIVHFFFQMANTAD